jgi:AcrR family transcriptional regulator
MEEFCDKRILRSKAALKDTFLTLLYQKPFDQITITEIVREANFNRGTFYSNFGSKEELLDEIIQDTLNDMINQIKVPYKTFQKVNMRELDTEKITLFHYFKDNAKLYNLLLSNHIRVDFRYQIAKAIEKLFIQEYEYEFTEGSHVNPKWFYVYRAHGIAGLIIRWMEEGFPDSPTYMAEQIVELMVTSTEVFYVHKGT